MKRKLIYFFIIPLLFTVIAGCTKKEEATPTPETIAWPNKDEVLAVDSSAIKAITYLITSVDGETFDEISDPAVINEIYVLLSNMEIQEKTTLSYDDYSTQIIFSLPKDEVPFNFEKDVLILSDDERYIVSNFSPMRELLENYEKPIITLPNGYLEARNARGYAFEYGPTGIMVTEGNTTTIYTSGERDKVPYYYVMPIDLEDQSIDEILSKDKETIIEQYGESLLETFQDYEHDLGERKAYGFQYLFEEDGIEYRGSHFLVPYDTNKAVSWVAKNEKNDTKTTTDMFRAMETFHFVE